ncbi:cellulose synthase subunit [Noviherbaspirillum humi]|uniref:Cyclic di-GMP-binding protein n=1 Tax=Noviherbaspirillum humi TaxID=1688639 RepID=A0A239HMD9_9BURK|nr:cellulose biosynthesis cyclic di-GMP-binding regulatory protein BcsB [Noviherbaspirillum humi]SNS82325.1 cellulose synthase subunit [Noviherbaspirillum humi]
MTSSRTPNSLPLRGALAALLSLTPLLTQTASAAGATPEAAGAPAAAATQDAGSPVEVRRLSLGAIVNQPVLRLRTTEGRATVPFGLRADELATKASLRVRYAYSPALIASQSHMKVLLNEEVVAVFPLTKENANRQIVQDVDIDPRLVTSQNNLGFVFVGHYATECEDPLHTSLWADISGGSELQLSVRRIPVKSDLAILPEPFFDQRDSRKLSLPFVFAEAPDHGTLRAAGIAASWFGKLAAWRGARFPVAQNEPPKGHAIVFATNKARPAFLEQLPEFRDAKDREFKEPALTVLTNPADGVSKLLLISGRDAEDLRQASTALALGNAALTGPRADVKRPREEAPRQAYDAPAWVRMDRPMKLGELVQSPQQLQVFGHVPDPVRVDLRMPPDLFLWKSAGVPMDLRYRYTPPLRASESRLQMAINDELVQAVNLRAASFAGDGLRVALPLLEGGTLAERRETVIPPFKVGSRNQLQYGFSFTYHKDGSCRDTQVENVRAMIDPDSTVDFSGFPHYAQMPNLGHFASAGYPFTTYADLGQTAVVMPEQASREETEAMLALMGRMGEATGYPATRVTVVGPKQIAEVKDKDLLLIGAAPRQSLLLDWDAKLPATIAGPVRRISQPKRSVNMLYDWLGFDTRPDTNVATEASISGSGPLAAVLGFESPLKSGRSVVALTGNDSASMLQALDALDDFSLNRAIQGSAAFVRGNRVESVLAGDTYRIGALPWWSILLHEINQRPLLSAALKLALGVLALAVLWRGRRLLRRRNKDA